MKRKKDVAKRNGGNGVFGNGRNQKMKCSQIGDKKQTYQYEIGMYEVCVCVLYYVCLPA